MLTEARIGKADFMRMFGVKEDEISPEFLEALSRTDTTWRAPTQSELEAYVLDVLQRIHEPGGARTPDENQQAFERGWRENLDELLKNSLSPHALRPRYFRPNKHLRYNRTLIVSDNLDLEYDLFTLARHLVFAKHLAPFRAVYEFGCGSCGNLLMLSDLFPEKRLWGLDWAAASVDIARFLADRGGRKVQGGRFDMFHPPPYFKVEKESAVVTVHALEQLGDRHSPWIEFLLRARPAIVINYEPILELYDPENLYDFLAIEYSRKRGYLSGYLTALRRLAEEGRVEILDARRPCLGGVIHEASLIVWRPT